MEAFYIFAERSSTICLLNISSSAVRETSGTVQNCPYMASGHRLPHSQLDHWTICTFVSWNSRRYSRCSWRFIFSCASHRSCLPWLGQRCQIYQPIELESSWLDWQGRSSIASSAARRSLTPPNSHLKQVHRYGDDLEPVGAWR